MINMRHTTITLCGVEVPCVEYSAEELKESHVHEEMTQEEIEAWKVILKANKDVLKEARRIFHSERSEQEDNT